MAHSTSVRSSADGLEAMLQALQPRALELTAEEGVRVLALRELAELGLSRTMVERFTVRDALRDAGETGDTLRMIADAAGAVDNLRATLREHRALLRIRPRLLHALRDLSDSLGRTQHFVDAIAWLERYSQASDAVLAEQARGLREALMAHAPTMLDVHRAFEKHFDPSVEALTRALVEYRERRVVGENGARRTLAAYLSVRVTLGAAAIERDVAAGSFRRLHLRALRQCRMVAPFVSQSDAIARWFMHCTATERRLSACLAAKRLARRARGRALDSLASALESDVLGLIAGLRSRLERAGAPSTDAQRVVAALDERSSTQQLPSQALPMEIERKFLLRAAPPVIHDIEPISIEQGWLPGVVLRERLRRARHPDGREVLTRTVKAGPLGARVELEEETTPELFAAMWPHTRAARIRKQRFPVPDGDFTWEIDVFSDRDLVLAEVELPSVDAMPALPDWLVPYVERDVTDEGAFTNSAMASPDPETGTGTEPGTAPDVQSDANLPA